MTGKAWAGLVVVAGLVVWCAWTAATDQEPRDREGAYGPSIDISRSISADEARTARRARLRPPAALSPKRQARGVELYTAYLRTYAVVRSGGKLAVEDLSKAPMRSACAAAIAAHTAAEGRAPQSKAQLREIVKELLGET
jgi:hypothetical protein